MKIRSLVLASAAALAFQLPVASAEGVFKAVIYDGGSSSVLARAGGTLAAPAASGARLVVKAQADEAISVQSLDPDGAVRLRSTLRTDALGVASAPLAELTGERPGAVLQIAQRSSGRTLEIGIAAARVAAR